MSILKRRILAFKYAFQGVKWAFSTQPNLWIHTMAALVAIILAIVFDLPTRNWILIILCISSVFACEFINTTIEWIVDSIYKEKNEMAGKIKDVAAAAVLFVAIGSAIVGILIFFPYFKERFF